MPPVWGRFDSSCLTQNFLEFFGLLAGVATARRQRRNHAIHLEETEAQPALKMKMKRTAAARRGWSFVFQYANRCSYINS
jgi:hypothetical protein